jgi:hypothetical protein
LKARTPEFARCPGLQPSRRTRVVEGIHDRCGKPPLRDALL